MKLSNNIFSILSTKVEDKDGKDIYALIILLRFEGKEIRIPQISEKDLVEKKEDGGVLINLPEKMVEVITNFYKGNKLI
jgi:hypothetical protein